MNYWLHFALVFITMTIADVCWALYFIKINELKSISAGIWGSAIYICGAFGILSYTEDRTLIIPAIIGAFLGTYLTVEYKKRKQNKN
jgi:uncharacterized protein YqgC (DUF456 family)